VFRWLSIRRRSHFARTAVTLAATDNIILSFTRNYGRSVFSQCRLDVVVYESRGTVTLWCDSTSLDSKGRAILDLNARQGTDLR
jgi:hypothetical protein